MKKIPQNENRKNSDQKPLGSGSIGHGVPTPVGHSFDALPRVSLSLAEWKREARRLMAEESFYNAWRGLPLDWRFDDLHKEGHSPLDALERWRDWEPWEDA